jgi:hypothetical protein
MGASVVALAGPAISSDVQSFAAEKGVGPYLAAVIDLARQAFPSCALDVTVGQDCDDEAHQYIAIDVVATGLNCEELLLGQRIWSARLSEVCPPRWAIYFVLGWR